MALLRQISRELTPQGQMGFQLLKSEKPPPAVMHEGILTHLQGNSPKWKESYCVLRGDSSLEWFGSKEVKVSILFSFGSASANVNANTNAHAKLNTWF